MNGQTKSGQFHSGVIRSSFEAFFARAQATRAAVDQSYRPTSGTGPGRCRMRVFPCQGDALVVTLSFAREMPRAPSRDLATEGLYRGAFGFIVQCSHCRRVQRVTERDLYWDWVPEYVAWMPENTSHGVCQICGAYFYGLELQSERDAGASAPPGPAAILVLERDGDAQRSMAWPLRGAGYRVVSAHRSVEALRAAERSPFDVVILSFEACDRNEREVHDVARAVRAFAPGAKFVFASERPPSEGPLVGSAFVSEPVHAATLLARVRSALQRS